MATIYYSVGNTPKTLMMGRLPVKSPMPHFQKQLTLRWTKRTRQCLTLIQKDYQLWIWVTEEKAYSDLSAGSSGLVWKAGRWSVMVTSVTGGGIGGENGVPASKIVGWVCLGISLFLKQNSSWGVLFSPPA